MRVDVGGGVWLFFDVVGSGLAPTDAAMVDKPTLLLLHGGPGTTDHSSFRPYFDRFADTHQVVYLDHRGQGRSDARRDPSAWDLDTWADDVVRFCNAVGVERPTVFGNSFGGYVAMRYAARHPRHPARLILSSTQARRFPEESARRFGELGGSGAAETYRRVFEEQSIEAMERYVAVNMPLYNTRSSSFGPRRSWSNLRVLEKWTKDSVAMDLRDDVAAIEVPTLVLAGAQDPMCPAMAATEIVSLLSPELAQYVIFEDCGHGSFRDQPEQTERALRAFLADG